MNIAQPGICGILSGMSGYKEYDGPTNDDGLAGHTRILCCSNEKFGAIIKIRLENVKLLNQTCSPRQDLLLASIQLCP